MKRLLAIILCAATFVACREPRTIPDDKLALIMRDLALVNAYAIQQSIPTDSSDIYTPVFDKYGYKLSDFRYTLTTFSKRKSSKVSDIVDATTKLLESEFGVYERRVAALDSVDARSRRLFAQEVKVDSMVRVRRISDTSRLRLSIPVKEGSYQISYRYTLDTLDKNYSIRSTFQIQDTGKVKRTVSTQWLASKSSRRISLTVEATDVSRRLLLSLGNYSKSMTTPHLTIDSLRIIYLPPIKQSLVRATDSLFKYKLKIDGQLLYAKDSLTPPLYSPRVVVRGGGDDK